MHYSLTPFTTFWDWHNWTQGLETIKSGIAEQQPNKMYCQYSLVTNANKKWKCTCSAPLCSLSTTNRHTAQAAQAIRNTKAGCFNAVTINHQSKKSKGCLCESKTSSLHSDVNTSYICHKSFQNGVTPEMKCWAISKILSSLLVFLMPDNSVHCQLSLTQRFINLLSFLTLSLDATFSKLSMAIVINSKV